MSHLLPIIITPFLLASPQEAPSGTSAKHPSQVELFSEREVDAVKQYYKVIDPMVSNYLNAELKFYELPENAIRIAKIKRSLYENLLKVGFSKEEAIIIVANTQIPSVAISTK